ncbi:hypothetical protein [Mycolicibacterium thermoresistibile]
MAKMVGAWIYVAPRNANQDVNLTVGGTILMTEADVRKVGDGLMNIQIRVMDDDSLSDDLVLTNNSFSFGARSVGPNSFFTGVIVPRAKVEDSEPWYESAAELYARIRAVASGVSTNWANSQTENVRFE